VRVKPVLLKALLILSVIISTGCATTHTANTPQVVGSMMTNGESLSKGKRISVQSFTSQDFVVYLVDFQWEPVTENGGSHLVEWRWYQNDKLLSRSAKTLVFTSTPYTTRTQRAASTLGVGHFRVETLVDGVIAASNDFDIAPH
jgi:hypothetical protein